MTRNLGLMAFLVCVSLHANCTDELVLTGSVSSSAKQIVNAPQGSRWQIQIQWMEEEGKIVQKGEPVVVFDGATEQTRLLTEQENLERYELELKQLEIEQAQKVIDAEGTLTVAKMEVDKARIEASVPDSEVSAYDKGQYELALQRAILEQIKAEEAFARAIQEKETALTQKQVDILKTQEEIRYLNNVLSQLRVVAKYTGPVSYAIHPWYGEKLASGASVRPSWKVLDVQSTEQFQIETWVHEIDAIGLNENTPVQLILDAFPGQTFPGKIVLLSPQSEVRPQWSKSAYFPAVVQFDVIPEVKLQPGMSVRIHIDKGAYDA